MINYHRTHHHRHNDINHHNDNNHDDQEHSDWDLFNDRQDWGHRCTIYCSLLAPCKIIIMMMMILISMIMMILISMIMMMAIMMAISNGYNDHHVPYIALYLPHVRLSL